MAAYNKFNQFVSDLLNGKQILQGATPTHTINVMASDVAPVATNTVFANITEIAAGNGYAAGGASATNTSSAASGTETVNCVNVTWTAAGGSIAQFRYIVAYNVTQAAPVKPLIGWWDNGSEVNLASGSTYTVKFNNGGANGTLFTLA